MKIAFFEVNEEQKEVFKKAFSEDELHFFCESLIDEVPDSIKNADIISVFVCSEIKQKILNQFNNLKLIVTRSTGYNHVDVKSAQEKNIVVSNVPKYADVAVAEYTFALLLALSRRIYDAYYQVAHDYSFSNEHLQGFDLAGKVLGVVGTGNIGRHVIRIANGFNMEILACDKKENKEFAKQFNFEYLSFNELIKKSDILTFHVPLIKETYHMINLDNIDLLKQGSYLINTARGGIIQTDALVKALNEGIIAGAALDVLEEENFTKEPLALLFEQHPEYKQLKNILENHVLIEHPRVIVTPHNAFNSYQALERLIKLSIENINKWKSGNPINIVQL
ncbi:MAG: NAD(P)-dependent oxidoreductase [Candidatus Babeliales bacterium]